MKNSIKRLCSVAATAVLALSLAGPVGAQEKPEGFPQRPIEIVVPYPAGGGIDVTARTLAANLERMTGHSFRVQNRVGGGGLVGNTYLAKQAEADGYTIGVLATPFVFVDFLSREGEFTAEDFEPLASVNFAPAVWWVRTDSDIGDLDFEGIIEKAKAAPGELTVGITPNNAFEFVTEIVEEARGVEFTKVPFQGGKPGITAPLGGNIDLSIGFYVEAEQYLKAGQLKAVVVSDTERFSRLPDTPIMPEVGVEVAGDTWGAGRVVAMPAGAPEPIRAYLAKIIYDALSDQETIDAFAKLGEDVAAKDAEAAREGYYETYESIRAFLEETNRLK